MSHLTSAEFVANEVRRRILTEELTPGTHLKEEQLASELAVSVTPVREALQRLTVAGLVEVIPRKGAFVAEFTLREVVDMLQVRECLEALAARRVAADLSDEQLRRLSELGEACAAAYDRGDSEAGQEADAAFHTYLVECTDNRWLVHLQRTFRTLRMAWEVLVRRHDPDGLARLTGLGHEAIIDALAARDTDRAEAAVREHIRETRDVLIRLLDAPNA